MKFVAQLSVISAVVLMTIVCSVLVCAKDTSSADINAKEADALKLKLTYENTDGGYEGDITSFHSEVDGKVKIGIRLTKIKRSHWVSGGVGPSVYQVRDQLTPPADAGQTVELLVQDKAYKANGDESTAKGPKFSKNGFHVNNFEKICADIPKRLVTILNDVKSNTKRTNVTLLLKVLQLC